MAHEPPSFDRAGSERAIAALIRALGLDPATEPELAETPARVADLYAEIFSGLDPASAPALATFPTPPSTGEDLVLVRDLPFYSLCVHHFVPFFGRAHVAYLPGRRLLGISGMARVLQHHARRPQLQERLAAQVADHLERALEPRGVAVVLQARHLCMEMRGIRSPGTVETRTLRGALAEPHWASTLPDAGGLGDPHGA
ncbi:MAG: GTP cyclohydrolase I [Candidatus Eisenbacteria bacterium]|uniref:GTP cyclohydrolase 1 n=1 Tax=Eiseniibacteriota bacterium TaxID=2212470 RepID=A0A538U1V7_UNCEI|nr:MAG: GTP cyclohydrolase I [Candidatus Eisenbacteria bacterium]